MTIFQWLVLVKCIININLMFITNNDLNHSISDILGVPFSCDLAQLFCLRFRKTLFK